jgi:hypothetical protein
MKTLNPTKKGKIKTNNNSLTLKNQKVMKTKKYSISMKTLAAVVFAFAFSAFLYAQEFVAPAPSSNTNLSSPEEVRAASTVTYDLNNLNHTAGDSYRWVVRGGTIAGGTDVLPDSSVLDWTVDATLITVTWDNTIVGPLGSDPGQIIVQKRVGGSCASQLQILNITMWNPATANFDLATLITEMCSGEAFAFTVPVDLTGAPDPGLNMGFDVVWEYEDLSGNLETLLGTPVNGITSTAFSNTATAQIPLPDGLVNIGTADETFTVRLTAMQDDFNVVGAVGVIFEYNITVHPTPATGEINSIPAGLGRR